jgi:hypothetical protein
MAQITGSLEGFNKKPGEDWRDYIERSNRMFDELQDHSDNLPEGQVEGAVISFPVADGSASYLITREKPLSLSHIPFLDGYHANPILIRGLRKSDVLQMLRSRKRLLELFSTRG